MSGAISTERCGPSRCAGVVWVLWRMLPVNTAHQLVETGVIYWRSGVHGELAMRGVLPRTRQIVPGELAISD